MRTESRAQQLPIYNYYCKSNVDKKCWVIASQNKRIVTCSKLTFQRKSSYLLCFAAVKDEEGSLIKSETAFVLFSFLNIN